MDAPPHSLQPPEPGPSRYTSSRAASIAVQPSSATNTPASAASRKQYRASHVVGGSPAAQQAAQDRANAQENGAGGENGQVANAGRDIYSHPAAVAYAQAHPRRAIPRFGPYLLLQTLGEGEFGKVKLGLHSQWGEEVAVKLIRRGNIDSSQRMTKVEREIEVLRTLKHPNIVRLYDVIETDKYIGIILEYASGGELFDHILAHRYLRERDASKLFAQLISGVWYIHQKKIVHRDLKLENLLLDRHRNVIITDFGFANRFEDRADDLMQTSCGSPCYAAPELVISEGMYVGTAVDIWSCGVILYAMLAGYLPFDDDPANPEGDNINLLYRYIVNTPLTFPDYISEEARDLLRLMLVPDPAHRGSLEQVMAHSWLKPYHHLFDKHVDDLEASAMEQQQLKRLAYQRQMKQAAASRPQPDPAKVARSQSARPELAMQQQAAQNASSRTRSHNASAMGASQTQPELMYETPADANTPPSQATRRGHQSAIVLPTSSPRMDLDDDPFAHASGIAPITSTPVSAPPAEDAHGKDSPPSKKTAGAGAPPSAAANLAPDGTRRKKDGGFRHTIQVELGETNEDGAPAKKPASAPAQEEKREHRRQGSQRHARRPSVEGADKALPAVPPEVIVPRESTSRPRGPSASASPVVQPHPVAQKEQALITPTVEVAPASPPATKSSQAADIGAVPGAAELATPTTSTRKSHKRGISVGKLFGGSSSEVPSTGSVPSSRVPSESSAQQPQTEDEDQREWYRPKKKQSKDAEGGASNKPSWYSGRKQSIQVVAAPPPTGADASDIGKSPAPPTSFHPNGASGSVSSKKSRRNTLTVMTEPIRSLKARAKRGASGDVGAPTPTVEKREEQIVPPTSSEEMGVASSREDVAATPVASPGLQPRTAAAIDGTPLGMPASSNKARKVMAWFRNKSKADEFESTTPPPQPVFSPGADGADVGASPSPATPAVFVTTPGTGENRERRPSRPSRPAVFGGVGRSSSTAAGEGVASPSSAFNRIRNSLTVGGASTPNKSSSSGAIRAHHGAVDQETVTERNPPEVMADMQAALEAMGIEVHQEAQYRLRCVRQKRRKDARGGAPPTAAGGVAAYSMVGSAGSNGVDRRGLPMPSHPHGSFSSGGMLRGLLMRRQSSQVSGEPDPLLLDSPTVGDSDGSGVSMPAEGPIYGERNQDLGDEIKFSVELTRITGLKDTYSIDIRRMKGDLRSYRFVYDTIKERANIRGSQ